MTDSVIIPLSFIIFVSSFAPCLAYFTLENQERTTQTTLEPPTIVSCKPQHVHISFGDTIQDMNVVWATRRYCDNCLVKYGTDPWQLPLASFSNHTFFTLFNEEGLQHLYKAQLKNLLPNTTYYYLPTCEDITSGPHFFKVPRIDFDWTPNILVFGDLGVESEFFSSLMKEALSGKYTAIFHVGDFAYNFIDDSGKKGDTFMELIEPAAAYTAYMTCPGNHEIDNDTFSHYRNRFAMPRLEWPTPVDQMWYSFDIGHVHFISYSTEVFFSNLGIYAEDQKDWLLKDLKEANRNRHLTPWVIAFGHRPLYCSTQVGDDCSQNVSVVRNELEDIFYNFSVDIVLQAHEHNYERLWPLYQGNVTMFSYTNADAPIQIISGAPGSREGEDRFPNSSQPVWSAFRMDDGAMNSYGRLLVMNSTHIWWEQRSASNHSTIDSIWIMKDPIKTALSTRESDKNISNATSGIFSLGFNKYSHVLAIGIVGVSFVVIVTFVVLRTVMKLKRKRTNQTWQFSEEKKKEDRDEEEDDEQNAKDSTSLL